MKQRNNCWHRWSIKTGIGRNWLFFRKRKHEWLSVRVLLKALCGEEKEIAYYSSGRPYLKDGSRYISISHTRGYVAVALHSSCEVGMDIEQYGTRVRKVASRFIRSDEEPAMMEGDEVYALLLHWSAKEALFKLMGVEEVDFIRHLRIFLSACRKRGSSRHANIVQAGRDVTGSVMSLIPILY